MHISPSPPLGDLGGGVAEYLRKHQATLSRSDRLYMSMADGLLADPALPIDYEPEEAYLEVAVGGHLVTAKPERPKGGITGMDTIGGARGMVTGFSRQSRNRLIRLIASTRKKDKPLFVTLTYPDEFVEDMSVWKRDIDTFGKRLARAFGDAGFIWRIEFVTRKSGLSRGRLAPHFHLLLWGVDLYSFREFAGSAWYAVVGSGDSLHRKAGTSSERVRTWNGVMSYVSKYVAKEQEYPSEWSGRAWGVIGRKHLPWAVRVIIPLSAREGVKLVRLGRKFLRLNGKTLVHGLTWLMDAERVLDYLEVIQGFS